MNSSMNIWILDAFHAGSHASWSLGLSKALRERGHVVTLHTLPGRHWKWRMHGAAATWADAMARAHPPQVVITTDMCDAAQLRGLMPRSWPEVRLVTMFHENQLTFPWSPSDPDPQLGRDNTYAYINVSSALASDQIWFNSEHHRQAFIDAATSWMKAMPKPHVPSLHDVMQAKSKVQYLGLDFQDWKPATDSPHDLSHVEEPILLWNHRWSWDKGTDEWMDLVQHIIKHDIPARFVVLGEASSRQPDGWNALREAMGSRCLHWGFVENREDYIQWLWKAHIAPVQPRQEYFGLSVVEAMRCRVIPWVPEEHAYPETMPPGHVFMPANSWRDGLSKQVWKHWPVSLSEYESQALEFSWERQAELYEDRLIECLAQT